MGGPFKSPKAKQFRVDRLNYWNNIPI